MALGASCNQLAQGIANTISSGVTYYAGKKLQQAQKNYNDTLTQLNKDYSGENANNRITDAASQQANITANKEMEAAKQQAPSTAQGTTAMSNANKAASNVANTGAQGYQSGWSEGAQNENTIMQGEYAGKKAEADAKLEQAQTDYKAGMAAAGGLQKFGQAASSAFSDERGKESPYENHDTDLPHADLTDAVAQLNSVKYKYKDPSIPGCDDEYHVGTTAQSLSKCPEFEDCVIKGEDGYLRVDEIKLMERIPQVIEDLQNRINKLRGN